MVKKQIKNKKIFIVLSILLILALVAMFLVKIFSPGTKNYHSNVHDYTIEYTEKFKLEENIDTVHLVTREGKEEITISGIGTNTDRLDDYLNGIASYNNLNLTNKENLTINSLSAIKVDINNKRYYLIYKDNWVYSLETDSPELYSDLDKIAESFRYEP